MLLAKLLIAGSLATPIVGYPDFGQSPHLTPHGVTTALSIAEDSLARCVAHNILESTTMSYTDAIVDAMGHSCKSLWQTVANVIERYYDDKKGNIAFELVLDELQLLVREQLGDHAKELPGL
jgi:hypothetical protein